jgi:hypothetical protein
MTISTETTLTFLAKITTIETSFVNALQRVRIGAMPQHTFIPFAGVRAVHVFFMGNVLFEQLRVLNAFNLFKNDEKTTKT